VGTKRDAKSPEPSLHPIGDRALDAALRLFVSSFVVDDKRTQIHKRLLAAERRRETLETLPRWLGVAAETLEGADRSPAGLRARLGDLTGIRLSAEGAGRTTITHALELGRRAPSVFIADSGNVAMLTVVDGPPLLCSRLGLSMS
jgi:hypothetical protein